MVLDAAGLDDAAMLAIAAEVGYSETAFVTAADGRELTVRYFSPRAEVSFCGHATVATAIALAERTGPGDFVFGTAAGTVPVTVTATTDDRVPAGPATTLLRATLTSVDPQVGPASDEAVAEALAALRWAPADLDPALPPRIAYAGARHLVLAAATRTRLADLDYDFDRLAAHLRSLDLTTVQLVWREGGPGSTVFHVRDPFPVGGVVEDPATGAAAAAFGAYVRHLGLVTAPATLTLHQGHDMGRPGLLTVTLREGDPRVRVSGTGVAIG